MANQDVSSNRHVLRAPLQHAFLCTERKRCDVELTCLSLERLWPGFFLFLLMTGMNCEYFPGKIGFRA